jgi:isoleucyl-tRNA synthetase
MDVWFDSGSSWAYVGSLADSGRIFWQSLSMFGIKSLAYPKVEEELGSPVDLYLEGQDQHRGWLGSEKRCRLAARQLVWLEIFVPQSRKALQCLLCRFQSSLITSVAVNDRAPYKSAWGQVDTELFHHDSAGTISMTKLRS